MKFESLSNISHAFAAENKMLEKVQIQIERAKAYSLRNR